jgi:hypothetical protein
MRCLAFGSIFWGGLLKQERSAAAAAEQHSIRGPGSKGARLNCLWPRDAQFNGHDVEDGRKIFDKWRE